MMFVFVYRGANSKPFVDKDIIDYCHLERFSLGGVARALKVTAACLGQRMCMCSRTTVTFP